jgi:hypothetical protein
MKRAAANLAHGISVIEKRPERIIVKKKGIWTTYELKELTKAVKLFPTNYINHLQHLSRYIDFLI